MKPELAPKLSAADAAKRIGITIAQLQKLRLTGDGPPFFKIGQRKVLYATTDIDTWLASRRTTRTPGHGSRSGPHRPRELQPVGV